MACVESLILEADIVEVAILANYKCDIVKEVNILSNCILLNEGVTQYHPVDDIYTEVRSIRRFDESLRVIDIPVIARGNEDKGGGKFTSRLAQFYDPWRIKPDSQIAVLDVIGEQISDVGTSGAALLDFSEHDSSVPLSVSYAPPDTELIRVSTGGSGASAQELWEYSDRTLTDAAGVTPQDISDIADAVWDEPVAEHQVNGSTGEQLSNSNTNNVAIANAVWSAAGRTLTDPAGVTAQDITDISEAVWAVTTRGLTENVNISSISASGIRDLVWGATSRTLTSTSFLTGTDITAIRDSVWTATARTVTADVSIDTASINAIRDAVWNATTKELTAKIDLNQGELDSIRDAVWLAASRTLTESTGLLPDERSKLLSLPDETEITNTILNTVVT